jgi:hypothetical protein
MCIFVSYITQRLLIVWNSMRRMGIPEHLIMLIRDVYTEQEAKM